MKKSVLKKHSDDRVDLFSEIIVEGNTPVERLANYGAQLAEIGLRIIKNQQARYNNLKRNKLKD